MIATAHDYTWFDEHFNALSQGYCLTLVQGMTAETLLARLRATTEGFGPARLGTLLETAMSGPRSGGYWDGALVGALTVEGWALLVEHTSGLGASSEVITALSAGGRVVSHSRNVELAGRFFWADDGDLRLEFDPLLAYQRWGSDPDALAGVMRQVGFDLTEPDDEDDEDLEDELDEDLDGDVCGVTLCQGATFALAEHLTGVRLTPELLERSTYLVGLAPDSASSWG
ncbi:hypothetical protein D5H75_31265 [Bailinhaonella thermotolerans]|uniref:Uncharacterized protein n=1 Tax=Bailinhaonella thermotolerans TaxID=1070861 RepID=A0A3A4A7L9_9ACTN|nr:hypothetical protein D5H75_31265 [Bailinhaonella thermotolerans]